MSPRWQALIVIVPVISAWGYILFKSDDEPDVLHKIAGCYQHTDATLPKMIQVESDGRFLAGSFETHVTGYNDKTGDSLSPISKVVVVQGRPDVIRIDKGYPLLIRASADHRSLSIMSETREPAIYVRVRC